MKSYQDLVKNNQHFIAIPASIDRQRVIIAERSLYILLDTYARTTLTCQTDIEDSQDLQQLSGALRRLTNLWAREALHGQYCAIP